jgi:large subunit ribosomal protein L4
MKIELLSSTKTQDINISDNAFSKDFNESLVHQAVVSYMSKSRQGTSKQKTRSEVRGGGKKPYAQKGTGRARAGTIRSPLWRGGGVTFAATPRDYSKKINKKMYKAAIRSIFSELLRQNRLVAIENPVLEKPKTKEISTFLKQFSLSKVLIITDELDVNFYLSTRNIPNVDVITVREINPVSLLKANKVAVTAEAFKKIEEWIDA